MKCPFNIILMFREFGRILECPFNTILMFREYGRILECPFNIISMFREFGRILECLNYKDLETMNLVKTATLDSLRDVETRAKTIREKLEVSFYLVWV